MIYLLILLPVLMAAVTFALASAIAGGRGSCHWGPWAPCSGRLGGLPAARRPSALGPGRLAVARSSGKARPGASRAASFSSARFMRRAISPCAPTGPIVSSAPISS